jgi:hypothetical protein
MSIREHLADQRRLQIEEAKMAEPNEEHNVIWAEDDAIERLLKRRRLDPSMAVESKVPDSHDEYWLTSQANPQWQNMSLTYPGRPMTMSQFDREMGYEPQPSYNATLRLSPLVVHTYADQYPESERWASRVGTFGVIRGSRTRFSRFPGESTLQEDIDRFLGRRSETQRRIFDEPMSIEVLDDEEKVPIGMN